MTVFVIVLIVFSIIFLVTYFPVICQNIVLNRAEKDFAQELKALNDFYENMLVIVTRRLGEGESQNSDVRFSCAHQNQKFAVDSVLDLIDEWRNN